MVDSGKPSELANGVESGVGDKLEREDGDDVYEEPGLEVATRNFSAAADKSLDLVVVSGEEGENDISEEDYVDKDLNELPLDIPSIKKAHLEGSQD